MGRVWNRDVRYSRETNFLRHSVRDGMKWAGTKLICRQAYQQQDIDQGVAEHCPYCWDEVLKQVSNTRCSHCFGTGYADGGYRPPFVTWGSIMENTPLDDKAEKSGLAQSQNMTIKLPSQPIFRDGDVFAEIRRSIDGRPLELGRVFKLDGAVRRQTVQGWVSNNTNDRESRVEDMIISQEGTVKLLLPSDPIYKVDLNFWGDGLEAEPYVDSGHVCVDGADYDDYAQEIDGRHIKDGPR